MDLIGFKRKKVSFEIMKLIVTSHGRRCDKGVLKMRWLFLALVLVFGNAWADEPAPGKTENVNQCKCHSTKTNKKGEVYRFIKETTPNEAQPTTSSDGHFIELASVVITALATFVMAIFTIRLWISTEKLWEESKNARRISEFAMIAGERAFVFAKDVNSFYELDTASGQYFWRFRPIWENSGDTPTKNMTMYTQCRLFDTFIPAGFDFDTNPTKHGVGLIPPRTTIMGGIAPEYPGPAISPQDIIDVQSNKKYLYVWGWARYWDVFPDTKQHITRFCWLISPVGNPVDYKHGKLPPEPGGLQFFTIHHNEGNCADDECAHQRKQYAS